MKKVAVFFVALLSCFVLYSYAWAEESQGRILLTVGQKEAWLGESRIELDAGPIIISGNTIVPLRFIGESLGSTVTWKGAGGEIEVSLGSKKIFLWIGKNEAKINDQIQEISVAPQLISDRVFVPLRFIAETFKCRVNFEPTEKVITIEKPNTPPWAEFVMDKTSIDVGEKVTYRDISSDPDGDVITDREWSGYQETFDTPGIYTISLRVKDSRGSWSDWFTQSVEATVPKNKPVAKFSLDKNKVIVGEEVLYTDESTAPSGEKIVDRVWENKFATFSKPGIYEVRLRVRTKGGEWSDWFSQNIEVVEKPNQAPVARFTVSKVRVDQGVTVTFNDESYDPDNDEIVEFQWSGKQRAYFKEGIFPVALKVKDKKGMWSEPFTVEIQVTRRVVMSELQYNLHNPLPGEIVNLTGISPNNFPRLEPVSQEDDDTTLLFSNSPETVNRSGILYKDTVSGKVRMMYSHKNGSSAPKRMYVLVFNGGSETVKITQTKTGSSGPSTDEFTVGQMGLIRYLTSREEKSIYVLPGQTKVLDTGGEGKTLYLNQCVYGMTDMVVEGQATFIFAMEDAGKNVLNTYASLPVLERDMHQRGTFAGANRTYHLEMKGSVAKRFVFGDNLIDRHLNGVDALTGESVVDKGNYGMVYIVKISAGTRLGILTNPRGGAFMGAGVLPDGTVYGIPEKGLIQTSTQAVMNTTLNKNTEEEFIFVPPASSMLPVSLLLMPF